MSYIDEEQEFLQPNLQFEAYNQQYSLILELAKSFLQQAKESIHKYLEKTKFPVYLNKGIVSKWAVNLENSLDNSSNFKHNKQYEFSEILVHIKRNIFQMIQFQKNFKKEFQQSCNKREKSSLQSSSTTQCSKTPRCSMNLLEDLSFSQSSQKETVISQKTISNKQEEQLRKHLRQIILPKRIELKIPLQNQSTKGVLERVKMKIDKMKNALSKEKQRQKSILNIFQRRKIIVPDINLEDPAISQLVQQIQNLKVIIQQKDTTIKYLQNKLAAMDKQSIVVQRYTIPKGQHLSSLREISESTKAPISLNFSFAGINSPKFGSNTSNTSGFKKKVISKEQIQ